MDLIEVIEEQLASVNNRITGCMDLIEAIEEQLASAMCN